MQEGVEPSVLGLPEDFDITEEQARSLGIDDIIAGASLDLGIFEASNRIATARNTAAERGDQVAVDALQILVLISGMGLSDDPRAPFGRYMSGHYGDGSLWHTPLPQDLTDRHVAVLERLFAVVTTPVLSGRIADVLWHRVRRRNPDHARAAVQAYLDVAEATFAPDHWVESEKHFARAFRIAVQLGSGSPELGTVVTKGWSFLERLDGNDPLYYTERIVARIIGTLSESQAANLFDRVKSVAEDSAHHGDFERSRVYYDSAITLARRLKRTEDVKTLRLVRAETHASQALAAPNETQRAMYLRTSRQELLNAGASRERLAEIAAMLDVSQVLAVSEMTAIGAEISVGQLPDQVRDLLRGRDPIEGLWRLAGIPVMMSRESARKAAEDSIASFHFAFGFGRRHISRDGREQGQTPGALGASEDEREEALRGAMRDHAAQGRVYTVLGAVEPGRRQLVLQHEYTLDEIHAAMRSRPLIPQGHHMLWTKGVHAGLLGEYDVAAHLLAPQLENALREVLHRRGEIVYSTRNGVQSVLSVENVLDNPLATTIFGDDYIFALDTVLAERLGANVRNDVAHGIIDDATSSSYDTAFLWWLALRLLRAYGGDPLARPTTAPIDGQPSATP